ncbi:hypothetical protein JAAARDRAFT_34574 [Jaapia argillacea MUCL 33604]|uniref:RRM domain-containing protein n=1 Tax=Jaapia argillacea MUCL 33604 TaxID=933084 RepID=A0A067PVG6_9AGAM|nr:hypothetical protein JAAARDRAFT_34574 [Jaapia argillacea MUCL 33604]
MQAPHRPSGPARFNTYHGPKRQLLGNHAGHAAPAWRYNNPLANNTGPQTSRAFQNGPHVPNRTKTQEPAKGSKVMVSNLPMDVGEKEVEELFSKTVGPLQEVFLVYNSNGRSKGIAVVTFQRAGDAQIARMKYHHKIVDSKKPIKIEIVIDADTPTAKAPAAAPPQPPSLLDRIAGAKAVAPKTPTAPTLPRKAPVAPRPRLQPPHVVTHQNPTRAVVPIARRRQKKGPKRVNKMLYKSVADLDREMDDYRAAADVDIDGKDDDDL